MSSMQNSFIGNGAGTCGDGPWNQVQSINMQQNTTPPVQNELPSHTHGQIIGGLECFQPALGAFIAESPTWASNKTNGEKKKRKRIRTKFSTDQLIRLEQEYSKSNYLNAVRRMEFAKMLRLNDRTIKIWFQNRCMKGKRDRVECIQDSLDASNINLLIPMHEGECQAQYQQPHLPVQPYQRQVTEVQQCNVPLPMHEGECQAQYQQPHLPVHPYQRPVFEVQQCNVPLPRHEGEYQAQYQQAHMPVQPYQHPVFEVQQGNVPLPMHEGECQEQYQQPHLPVQPYQPPVTEFQHYSLEAELQTDPPTSRAPAEESSDLSWINFSLDIQS